MEDINVSSLTDVINAMEKKEYLKWTLSNYGLSAASVKDKIVEFSEFFNGVGRLSLFRRRKSDSEEFISLLLTLKRSIKYALNEIGRSGRERNYKYCCGKCKEEIDIDPHQNFWTCLQNHEHVEDLYKEFLNGNLDDLTKAMTAVSLDDNSIYTDPVPSTSNNIEFNNENADSGIDNEICEADQNENSDFGRKPNHNEENVNSFRFNFVVSYDDVIAKKIYPESLIKAVRKIDKIREYTVQKSGPSRGMCLLCSCDIIAKNKVTKFVLEDHSMGHRHIRYASTPENLACLKKYHEFWLNLDLMYQAHQVYFKPYIQANCSFLKCEPCNLAVSYPDVLSHIKTNPHKKMVIDMFQNKANIYYLVELQMQVYGNTAQVETKEKEVKKAKIMPKNRIQIEKTDSDSSPSSESKEPKHNIIKSVENATSENVLDLIPNRYREHLKYLKNNGKVILCDLCNVTIPKNVEQITKHTKHSSHIKASDIVPKKYTYYCEICNEKFLEESLWNYHFTDGPNRHANMAESRKGKTTEYECTKCCTVIYGDELSLTRHLSVNLKRGKSNKEVKLPLPVQKLLRTKETVELESMKLTFEANDTLKYNQLTKECCTRLETTLSVAFEGCKAYPFGSRISGLGDQYSDLDVFIDTGGMYTGYKNQDPLSQVQLVRKAASIFNKSRDEFQEVVQIPTARTPIVKLYHRMTDIECDLSFRHGLSVENTKFLRFCLDLQPITQPFILLLKKWSQHNNFTEHISTYALALMAIFYLQINNHLLSVKKLRKLNPTRSLVINGWNTINYTTPIEKMQSFVDPYPKNICNLLRDFFGYYAKFKYSVEVICPLLGRTILKKLFQEGNLPEEMHSYVAQLLGEEPEQFRDKSPICLQDPFDLSHNLTKACQPGTLQKFKTMCDLTFKHLEKFV